MTRGDWKLVNGTNYRGAWDNWYGPEGDRKEKSYKYKAARNSITGRALSSINMLPSKAVMKRMRKETKVKCLAQKTTSNSDSVCEPLNKPCLFNIKDDPCEKYNLAEK